MDTKRQLQTELVSVVKNAVRERQIDSEKVSSDVVNAVCNVTEAIFIHGLKEVYFLKVASTSSQKYPEPAWIRLALNEGTMENYVEALTREPLLLKKYFHRNAFLRDDEQIEIMKDYMKAVNQINFKAPTNSSILNSWTPTPLKLAGLLTNRSLVKKSAIHSIPEMEDIEIADDVAVGISALEFEGLEDSLSTVFSRSPTSSIASSSYNRDNGTGGSNRNFGGFLPATPTTLDESVYDFNDQASHLSLIDARFQDILNQYDSNGDIMTGGEDHGESIGEVIVYRPKRKASDRLVSPLAQSPILKSDYAAEAAGLSRSGVPVTSTPGPASPTPKAGSPRPMTSPNMPSVLTVDSVPSSVSPPGAIEQCRQPDELAPDLDIAPPNEEEQSTDVSTGAHPPSESTNPFDEEPTQDSTVEVVDRNDMQESTTNQLDKSDSSTSDLPQTDSETQSLRIVSSSDEICSFSPGNSLIGQASWSSGFISNLPTDPDANFSSVLQRALNNVVLSSSPPMYSNSPDAVGTVDSPAEKVSSDDSTTNGFVVVTNNEAASDSASVQDQMLPLLWTLAGETGLDAQKFKCASCAQLIGLMYGIFRICSYDGRCYCTQCHFGDQCIIPARVIFNWDFAQRKVSRSSKAYLSHKLTEPVIDMQTCNPDIYTFIPEMAHTLTLRRQLSYVAVYLLRCKESIAEDLRKRCWPREYMFEQLHLYSFQDLLDVHGGQLQKWLKDIINMAMRHVLFECRLCVQKGFICEICGKNEIIYPFQLDTTQRCDVCFSVFHISCIDGRPCTKCQRREQYLKQKEQNRDSARISMESSDQTDSGFAPCDDDDVIQSMILPPGL